MGHLDKQLAEIAKKHLFMETLETRNSGEDFCEVACWSVKAALEEAYRLGTEASQNMAATAA